MAKRTTAMNYNPNAPSAESQCGLILDYLKSGNRITTMRATQAPFYCYRLSGRIWDLRHKGYDIKDCWKVVGDKKKQVKEYFL